MSAEDETATAQPPEDPGAPVANPPATAIEALDRATAAYRFGDLPQMVTMSRLVAEGAVPGNDRQRALALQLLGVGLYLSGRHEGAELALTELFQLDPDAELDPTQTRPEVVAFFRRIKRQTRPKKSLTLAFLPPFGQFQNETPVRGWVILGLESLTLATFATTGIILNATEGANNVHSIGAENARRVKAINWASFGALAATWTYGVIDALLGMRDPDPNESFATLTLLPNGAAIRVSF